MKPTDVIYKPHVHHERIAMRDYTAHTAIRATRLIAKAGMIAGTPLMIKNNMIGLKAATAVDGGTSDEDAADPIVDAVICILQTASTQAMPAFAFHYRVEHSARTGLRPHCVQIAGVRFFLESAFAQKIFHIVLVGQGPISLI